MCDRVCNTLRSSLVLEEKILKHNEHSARLIFTASSSGKDGLAQLICIYANEINFGQLQFLHGTFFSLEKHYIIQAVVLRYVQDNDNTVW